MSRLFRKQWAAISTLLLVVLLGSTHTAAQPLVDDPFFAEQWALERVGALCAWQRTMAAPK